MFINSMLSEPKTTFSAKDSGLVFTWAVLFINIAALAVAIILSELISETALEYISLASIQITMILTCRIYCKKRGINFVKAIKLNKNISGKNTFASVGLGVTMMYASVILILLFTEFLELIGYTQPDIPLTIFTVQDLILGTIFYAMLPAICEEILMRGIVFQGLRKFGDFYAITVSAALFMLMHANPMQTVFPLIAGLTLGYVFLKTGNIIYPMIIHFINNFISVLLEYGANNMDMPEPEPVNEIFLSLTADDLTIIAIAIFLFISCILYLRKNASMINEQSFNKIFKPVCKMPGGFPPLLINRSYGLGAQPFQPSFGVTGANSSIGSETQQPNQQNAQPQETMQQYQACPTNNIYKNAEYLLQQGFYYDKANDLFILKDGEYQEIIPPLGFEDVTRNGRYNPKYATKKSFILLSLAGMLICAASWLLMFFE